MTRRDFAWRTAGGCLFAAAACVGLLRHAEAAGGPASTSQSLLGLLCFLLCIVGIVLMIHGKRVAAAWRAELRHHRATSRPSGRSRGGAACGT